MHCFGPKSTTDVPSKQRLLVQTVLSDEMWLLAWAWQGHKPHYFFPKSFVCRVCYNSENRQGATNFCVTVWLCLKKMLLPNRVVFKFEKMQKRTFPSPIPTKGAGSAVYSRVCFIPVRGTAFLFPPNVVELWDLSQDSGCLFPVGLLSSVLLNYNVSVNGVCIQTEKIWIIYVGRSVWVVKALNTFFECSAFQNIHL